MITRTVAAAVLAALALCGTATAQALEPVRTATLQEQIPIGTGADGRQLLLGGFSGLYPQGRSGGEFFSLTDRGPNADFGDFAGFWLPQFSPEIFKFGVGDDRIKVNQRIALHLADGRPVTGLPNLAGDQPACGPYDAGTLTCPTIPIGGYDPYGVDSEGVVVDPRDGTFWISDEYRPSVLHVDRDGTILGRVVPAAGPYTQATAPAIDVDEAFPAAINKFRKNRGFEGVAISPDGTTLYTALQSPMRNPVRAAENNGIIRVFRLDVTDASAPVVTAEWAYVLQKGLGDAGAATTNADKVSDLVWLGPDQLLIEERDADTPTRYTALYRADFAGATNLLGTALEAATSGTTLESLVAAAGDPPTLNAGTIATARKSLLVRWDAANPLPNGKVEGIAVVDRPSGPELAVVNDNDFGVGEGAATTRFDSFRLP